MEGALADFLSDIGYTETGTIRKITNKSKYRSQFECSKKERYVHICSMTKNDY